MAPALAVGAVGLVVAPGLAVAIFLLPRARELPAPTSLSTLLPFGALVMGGLAIHDRVVTRGEGLGLVLLFLLSVGAILWEAEGAGGLALWPRRLPSPSVATNVPPTPNPPAPRTGADDLRAAASPPAFPVPAGLAGRLAPTDDLATPALGTGGLALCVVGAFLVVRGAGRVLDRTAFTAGFVGFAMAGPAAGAGVAYRVAALARSNDPRQVVTLIASAVTATPLAVLGVAGLVRPLVVDAAGAVAFLGTTAVAALAWTVLLARGRGGRRLGVVLVTLYAGLIWSALHV